MILAIDIGGTAAKLGLLDRNGTIHARKTVSVSYDHYQTPILTTVLQAASGMLAAENVQPEGIAISATGQVDTSTGAVIGTNGKIPGYEGSQMKAAMEKSFHVPTWVLNDANAAALGEAFLGAGRGYRDVLMITLGTGVGGGLILNGQLYEGRRGLAGELGHFTLYQDGVPCSCGKRGCYESYAATTALMRLAGTENGLAVFEGAAAGDPAMLQALDHWIDDIAAGLTGLIHIFNPQLVLIGGGVSVQEDLLMKPLREKVLRSVMPRFAEQLEIRRATLGNDAGMVGALRYWLDRQSATGSTE